MLLSNKELKWVSERKWRQKGFIMGFFKNFLKVMLVIGVATNANAAINTPASVTVTISPTVTITAGGVSQVLFNTNQQRTDCFVQNLESTDVITVSFKAAAASVTSISLAYLDSFNCANVAVVTDQINIFGPTTGDKFIAYEIAQGAGRP